ncbi:putative Heat shock protein HSP14.7/HSP23.5/HSP23.6 [Helianthus debilis subsp. tardiflorus]
MASSLRLITSNLLSRSVIPFRPTVVSASRYLSHNASPQSSTTLPTDEFFDQSWLRMQMNLWPKISSMSFHMEKTAEGRSLTLNIPGVEMMETNEGLCVSLNMPGLKKEDMKACVEHNTLFMQGKTNNECCLGGIKLTDKTSGDMKEEMEDGMLKITLPNKKKFKTNFFSFWKKYIIAKFSDHSPYSGSYFIFMGWAFQVCEREGVRETG